MTTKIYYIANARMPTEKAHGIQIAKMCEAFVALGIPLELVVSSRGSGSIEQVYNLTQNIPVRRLPVLDLQFVGTIGYRLTALQFVLGALVYVWAKVLAGERFVVYTVDMDPFSFAPLVWVPRPVFAEMHGVKRPNFLRRAFFRRANIIATNTPIARELAQTFSIPPERMFIEPNGVDEAALRAVLSHADARHRLGLPDEPFALYVGLFYPWKGLEILVDAATDSPLPIHLVGGTREQYERVTGTSGERLHFHGIRPVSERELWLAAADVLLLVGTALNDDSYLHTSPMKTFEYLGARRATVAAATPAMQSIMKENTAFWYKPDDARSLSHAIREAHTSPEAKAKVEAGYALAEQYTWRKRAERILAGMQSLTT